MARVSGSIGIRQDLEVRAGHTLTPQIAPIGASGTAFDPTGGQLVVRLLREELASEPLIADAFDPPVRLADAGGHVRFRITQSRARLAEALLEAGPEPVRSLAEGYNKRRRRLWWTCSWQDAAGELYPLYFGHFDVWLGAAGG